MNEHRKSHSSVVPMKPSNKVGQLTAEEVKGRGLAEGNLCQQNAPRTQRREGAPSALERVRLAAARDRRMRFTALLHHIYDVDRLRAAYSTRTSKKPSFYTTEGGTEAGFQFIPHAALLRR